jgi:ABC-2 type transport system ATP-binding protein
VIVLETVIQTNNLTKRFGAKIALSKINLSVRKGEFFGCLGPNGAGKTTLLKILTAQIEPSDGSAKVLGFDVSNSPYEIKHNIGIVPEIESPPSYLTAYEYLYFVCRVRKVMNFNTKIHHWLNFFELEDVKNILCRDLSKGMRQKLMIASAMIHKPRILFLDEPFTNIDPIFQKKIKDLFKKYVADGGTIFLCTHMLEIVEKLCTEVAILDSGRIVARGDIDNLKSKRTETLEQVFLRLVQRV